MRSRNNNMFHYTSYWGHWSRILFHDAGGRGMEKMREKYGIPQSIKTIEVDIVSEVDRMQCVNIRTHCTEFAKHDRLVGTLPEDIVCCINHLLTPAMVNAVVHADLLKYIDWDKYQEHCNGGAAFKFITRDFMTLNQYWSMQRQNGGGPGLLRHDVEQSWQEEARHWQEQLDRIIP